MRSTARRENLVAWTFFVVTTLAVNPPILTSINPLFRDHPLLFGWPTMWLYLTFWYVVMIMGFVFFALRFKSWRVEPLQKAATRFRHAHDGREG